MVNALSSQHWGSWRLHMRGQTRQTICAEYILTALLLLGVELSCHISESTVLDACCAAGPQHRNPCLCGSFPGPITQSTRTVAL